MPDVKPLPAPPVEPYDTTDLRILTDGDTCDAHCPAIAYVRVYMYRAGDKEELAGTLHFCAHHWHEVAATIWAMSLNGECSIIDETSRLDG